MKSVFPRMVAGLALLMSAGITAAHAQEFAPHIGYVYPAGGQQGTTFQVTVGGQYLVAPAAAYVSGGGVKAAVIPTEPLLTGKQAAEARGKLKELRKQRTAASRDEIRKISRQLALHEQSKITPAIGEKVTVQITIATDAKPGNREIRLVTATGLTNPLVFQVGQLPECNEPKPEQNEKWTQIQKTINNPDARVKAGRNDAPPMRVTLPTTINGQILAGEADRFQLKARRGQKLLVAVSGRELLPYLADTVPGWLQATVTLFDSGGNEVKSADTVQIGPDPLLRYEIPSDGEYMLEIRDNLYRGRDDFVYRIRIGGEAQLADTFSSGAKLITPLPASPEKESNNTFDDAQLITLPALIKGRIDEPGDIDVFCFEGKTGGQIVAEVYARRLDSPLDSLLIISDAAGNRIGFNDDHEDKGSGLNTHHADSYLAATLPADGTYYVQIADTQQNGGAAHDYHLRISAPQPDFALRVVPSTINIRGNATQPVTVYALRRDGFAGDIALTLKDSPSGFQLSGAKISAGQDKVHCTLTAPDSRGSVFRLVVEGRATIGGETVVRAAVPAQELTQAFFYQHLVPSADLLVFISEKFAPKFPAKIIKKTPIKISARGTVKIQFSAPRYTAFDAHEIRLLNPPEGISIQSHSLDNGRLEIVIESNIEKPEPGFEGNLIAAFVAKNKTPPGAPKIKPKRVPLGVLPAIPFKIVGDQKP